MRSLVTPETFTAFMQNLKLEHYQKKKKEKKETRNTASSWQSAKLQVGFVRGRGFQISCLEKKA